jgi:hypothetical protein
MLDASFHVTKSFRQFTKKSKDGSVRVQVVCRVFDVN